MARLYANENSPLPVVEGLRHLGRDVPTMQEAGQVHGINPDHAGIVVCLFDSNFTKMAQRVHETIKLIPQLSGQLFRINRPIRD